MKLALIGDHPDVLPLLGAIQKNENHQLIYATCLDEREPKIRQLHPAVKFVSNWDQLLTADEIDSFILAGNSKESQLTARTIASENKKPFIIFPLPGTDWTAIYDFTYIQNESSIFLLPVLNYRFHPFSQILEKKLSENVIGEISRIEFQRELSTKNYPKSLNQLEWDPVLLHAIDFLRYVGGNYHKVTSIPGGMTQSRFSNLNLTLAGDSLPDAQATFRSSTDQDQWKLTIIGSSGKIEYSGQDDQPSRKLLINEKEEIEPKPCPESGESLLRLFEEGFNKEKIKPDWSDLTYSYELLTGSHRSIKRSRTIEVHHDTTSERSQFKTQMTAVGCVLLMITLGLMIGLMILGNVLDPRETIEIQADAANSIIYVELFEDESPKLTASGEIHLSDIASRFDRAPFTILIEQTNDPDPSKLDEARAKHVLSKLNELELENPENRTTVAIIKGKLFTTVMKIGRVLVFIPLVIFLGFQFLLGLSRPGSK